MTNQTIEVQVDTSQLLNKLDRVGSAFKVVRQAVDEFNDAWLELPEDVRRLIIVQCFGQEVGQSVGRIALCFE